MCAVRQASHKTFSSFLPFGLLRGEEDLLLVHHAFDYQVCSDHCEDESDRDLNIASCRALGLPKENPKRICACKRREPCVNRDDWLFFNQRVIAPSQTLSPVRSSL
jgi:hypothetical protein